jgi:hypothetical protein
MFKGFRTIFWGIFFITFHINIGPIPILPAFVGYMYVSRGIDNLRDEFSSPYFWRARIVSLLLTILAVFSFLLIFVQQQHLLTDYYLLLFSILELFLIYYILEGSREYFAVMNREELISSYRNEQRAYTVFMTIYIIGLCIAITIGEGTLSFAMILIGIFLRLWLMTMLGRLKRSCQEQISIVAASGTAAQDNSFHAGDFDSTNNEDKE